MGLLYIILNKFPEDLHEEIQVPPVYHVISNTFDYYAPNKIYIQYLLRNKYLQFNYCRNALIFKAYLCLFLY